MRTRFIAWFALSLWPLSLSAQTAPVQQVPATTPPPPAPVQQAPAPASAAAPAQQQPTAPPPPVTSVPLPTEETRAGRTLTLADAVQSARTHQPSLRQAEAAILAARARVDQAIAPYYPQVNATASYQRTTGNFVPRAGAIPTAKPGTGTAAVTSAAMTAPTSFTMYNFMNAGLTVNQLVYDFGQTLGRKHAAEASAEAQEENERSTQLQVDQNVRVAFFNARAAKALLAVARETLDNYERHLQQIEGFVRAGTRAEIDLAQARTDRANGRVNLINAENAYTSAKAALNQAMGVEGTSDYEVADDTIPEVAGEEGGLDLLVQQALKARPEFASLEKQVRAQELTADAIAGARWPTLGVSAGATEGGRELDNMVWNMNAGVNLNWPIFQGGITIAQVDEVRANIVGLRAQEDVLRQQVHVDVETAQLAVRAAKAVMEASDEAVTNARERQRLAEGRYATGVGSGIELADAELAQASALSQRVQAEYSLSSARANLLKAVGQP